MDSNFYKLKSVSIHLMTEKLQKQDCEKWGRKLSFNRLRNTLTRPVVFKTVKEMEDHHDQRMEGDECNVHLRKKQKKQSQSAHENSHFMMPHYNFICGLTAKSTKYFWLFSPTQLLTHGQWWSIFRMQRLQTLQVDKVKGMEEHSNSNASEWTLQQLEYRKNLN